MDSTALIVAVVGWLFFVISLVINIFLMRQLKKIDAIEKSQTEITETLHEMDKRILAERRINEMIDAKINQHCLDYHNKSD